jgi:hypothetical protein
MRRALAADEAGRDSRRFMYLLCHARQGSLEAFVAITQLDHMHDDDKIRAVIDKAIEDPQSYPRITPFPAPGGFPEPPQAHST